MMRPPSAILGEARYSYKGKRIDGYWGELEEGREMKKRKERQKKEKH